MKNINYYMALPYKIEIIPDPIDGGFVAQVPELRGCITQADTWEELGEMIEDAKRSWILTAMQFNDVIPEPIATLQSLLPKSNQ